VRTLLRRVGLPSLALLLIGAFATATPVQSRSAAPKAVTIGEFTLSAEKMDVLRGRWLAQLTAKYGANTWAPMKMDLSDADLALMGLPSHDVLRAQRYNVPTSFQTKASNGKGGKQEPTPQAEAASPGLVTFAGTGFFGIRPGAWLLYISDAGVGWCSAAHVFGSPGSYQVSTAGHCGKSGDIVSMIGVVGDNVPVILDIGRTGTSVDGGLGNDYAFIDVYPEHQHLVTPTMAFWGGPRGVYTSQGDVVATEGNRIPPDLTLNPDPTLAQQIVHYGHGTGVGTGGTPRSASAISWRADNFMFFGAISPGDSGSGSNTLLGDAPGDNMEAAGINTHLYVDLLMRQGFGIMGGTRASKIGTPANGQIVPYPVPAPGLP
jgi:hypothetical protein